MIQAAPVDEQPPPDIDLEDAFVASDEQYFQGEKLNTSARRYIFLTHAANTVPEASLPAAVVFTCLSNNYQIAVWTRDLTGFIEALGDWVDAVGYLPGADVATQIGELADAVLEGWTGGGNTAEDNGPGESPPT